MTQAAPTWRLMQASDIAQALALAERVHADLPEDEAVFAERLALYAPGCLVLDDGGRALRGYALSHPIRRFAPPPLNSRLGAIAVDADDFFIHDMVVAPELRGTGLAASGIARLLGLAAAYPSASLISVYGTSPFWARFGFEPARDAAMADKLRAYGSDAVYMIRPRPDGLG